MEETKNVGPTWPANSWTVLWTNPRNDACAYQKQKLEPVGKVSWQPGDRARCYTTCFCGTVALPNGFQCTTAIGKCDGNSAAVWFQNFKQHFVCVRTLCLWLWGFPRESTLFFRASLPCRTPVIWEGGLDLGSLRQPITQGFCLPYSFLIVFLLALGISCLDQGNWRNDHPVIDWPGDWIAIPSGWWTQLLGMDTNYGHHLQLQPGFFNEYNGQAPHCRLSFWWPKDSLETCAIMFLVIVDDGPSRLTINTFAPSFWFVTFCQ